MNERPSRRAFLRVAAVAGVSSGLTTLVRAVVEAATYFEQGRVQFRRGDLQAAIISLTRAIEMDPADVETLDLRSVVFESLNDHYRAMADRTALIRLNPSSHNFLMRGVYGIGHDSALAVADFTEVIHREPQNGDAFEFRAIVHEERGRLDLALADYRTAQALDPEDAEPLAEDIARVERLVRKG